MTGVLSEVPVAETGGDRQGELADQRARDAISGTLDHNLRAVAGAGTGKTRHLVERLVNILLSGVATIDRIAAITFTESAAGELRDRVAETLDRAADGTGDPARRAVAALDGLDGAAITTLHGFARRVLADHVFEAGLPPAFEVLDEVRSAVEREARWGEALDALLEGEETARALRWVLSCGGRLVAVRVVAEQLGENWDRLRQLAEPPALPSLDPAGVLAPLGAAVALAERCSDPEDRLLVHLHRLAALRLRLEAAAGHELEILPLLHPTKLACTGGRKGSWSGHKPEVVDLLRRAEEARSDLLSRAWSSALATLVWALGQLTLKAAERRRRDGRLEFHDLLVMARDLVRDDVEVRCSLHHKYRCLLVDELQDTDPLQAELVTLIAAAPDAPVGERPWAELPVADGALFFVGDPRQSIYRFRRADAAIFDTLGSVAPRSESLVSNFRSTRGIVEWVNAVFGRLFEGARPPFEPAEAVLPAEDVGVGASAGLSCTVTVVGAPAEPTARAREVRRAEARAVAGVVRHAIDARWRVGRDGREVRPTDVTVLVATRGPVRALEAAFDEVGIPCRLVSSSLVYSAPEVHDLVAVLRAVDDPSDGASVVGALRTPAWGCGDDDLLRFKVAGGDWDYRRPLPDGLDERGPVAEGLAALCDLYESRAWTTVSDLVARVVDERKLLAAALEGSHWREEWRRLRFVADQARQFTESSNGGLREFLAWVELQRSEDVRVTEVVLPEPDAEAVSIMTVHAAKGLQFPVVGVVGFGTPATGVRSPGVLFPDAGPELSLGKKIRSDGWDVARSHENEMLEQERLRLLYVACTRAQNHLIASVHRTSKAERSVAAQLAAALSAVGDGLWRPADASSPAAPFPVRPAEVRGPTRAPATPVEDVVAEARSRWVAGWERRMARPPAVVAATAVPKLAHPRSGVDENEAGDEVPAGPGDTRGWRRGRAGTAVGRAVHAVLQTVDLGTGEGLEALAGLHAEAEGVRDRAGEVARLARAALGTEIVRVAAAGRHWRELYVGAPVGDRILEGFVDLLFDGPHGLEVVDYKTDRVQTDTEIDGLVARYRLQGAAYALAAGVSVGRLVHRCSFLFLRRDHAVVRAVPDLDEAVAEVRGLLQAE